MKYSITQDAHGQSWINIEGSPTPLLLLPQQPTRKRGIDRPRYITHRLDSDKHKECLTLFECKRFARGSSAIIHDLRAARGKWAIRLIGPRGGIDGEVIRTDPPPRSSTTL